jgi:hypothetical protein
VIVSSQILKEMKQGAIGHFSEGTGLPWTGIRLWDTKAPFLRPRCIGTVRARIQMLIDRSINQRNDNKRLLRIRIFYSKNI